MRTSLSGVVGWCESIVHWCGSLSCFDLYHARWPCVHVLCWCEGRWCDDIANSHSIQQHWFRFVVDYSSGGFDGGASDWQLSVTSPVCESSDTCANGVQDGDETATDCGGSCPTECVIVDESYCEVSVELSCFCGGVSVGSGGRVVVSIFVSPCASQALCRASLCNSATARVLLRRWSTAWPPATSSRSWS